MLGSKEPPIGNRIWAIKCSRDRWCHDLKGAVMQCCRLSWQWQQLGFLYFLLCFSF